MEFPVEEMMNQIPQKDTPECDMCKFVVELADDLVRENRARQFINSTVYTICNILPEDVKAACIANAPGIVDQVEKGLDPQTACAFINLCAKPGMKIEAGHIVKSAALTEGGMNSREASTLCTVCEFVVKTLDFLLKGNKTEEALNSTIYKLCDLLPSTEKNLCDMMAPLLVKELHNGFDPKKACTAVNACRNSTKSNAVQHIQQGSNHVNLPSREEELVQASTLCTVCEFLVKTLDFLLEGNKSEAAVNSTIYELCNLLPGTDKAFVSDRIFEGPLLPQ
ncbi:hypothetical protein ScPMuIL_003609 [Solemya velum]